MSEKRTNRGHRRVPGKWPLPVTFRARMHNRRAGHCAKRFTHHVLLNSAGRAFLNGMRGGQAQRPTFYPYVKETSMRTRLIAVLLPSLLLAGAAWSQSATTDSAGHAKSGAHSAHGNKASTGGHGPSGTSRDDNTPSVSRQQSAAGSPGATADSNRLSGASGTSSSGATGVGQGSNGMDSGQSRQIGSGTKSSGTAGSSGSSGSSDAAGSGGMGGGATGGTMR